MTSSAGSASSSSSSKTTPAESAYSNGYGEYSTRHDLSSGDESDSRRPISGFETRAWSSMNASPQYRQRMMRFYRWIFRSSGDRSPSNLPTSRGGSISVSDGPTSIGRGRQCLTPRQTDLDNPWE